LRASGRLDEQADLRTRQRFPARYRAAEMKTPAILAGVRSIQLAYRSA
jgi:hypothetical protein